MPTLISRGAASGKAFGLTSAGKIETVTFTSSGTWVAPAGVTQISVLSGKGQDGSPVSYLGTTQYWASKSAINWGNPAYAQWGDLYGEAVTARNALLAAVGGYGPSNVLTSYQFNISSINDSWAVGNQSYSDYSSYIIDSVGSFTTEGNVATSGNIVSSALAFGVNAWKFTVNYTAPGFLGASSTAIGKTFPGGNNVPAPTTIFTNVAVTPGTSYPINVASGGSVTIQYLA